MVCWMYVHQHCPLQQSEQRDLQRNSENENFQKFRKSNFRSTTGYVQALYRLHLPLSVVCFSRMATNLLTYAPETSSDRRGVFKPPCGESNTGFCSISPGRPITGILARQATDEPLGGNLFRVLALYSIQLRGRYYLRIMKTLAILC